MIGRPVRQSTAPEVRRRDSVPDFRMDIHRGRATFSWRVEGEQGWRRDKQAGERVGVDGFR